MRERTRPEEPTDRDFHNMANAALAAAQNAIQLWHEANLLLQNGHHARALALAVSSLEESGKHSMFMSQSLHFTQAFWESIERGKSETRQHRSKHGAALDSLEILFRDTPLRTYLGQDQLPALIDRGIDKVRAIMHDRREDALYVRVTKNGRVTSPSEAVSAAESAEYVRLAGLAAASHGWTEATTAETLAAFLHDWRVETSAMFAAAAVSAEPDPRVFLRAMDEVIWNRYDSSGKGLTRRT